MTVRFAGTEPEDFDATDDYAQGVSTNTSTRRSANTRLSMGFSPGAANAKYRDATISGAAMTELWLHAEVYLGITSTMKHFMKFKQGATDVIGLICNTTTAKLDIQKYSGSWSTVASTTTGLVNTTRASLDVYLKLGNPGTLKVYIDNVKVYGDATLNLSVGGITGLDNIRLENSKTGSLDAYMSEVIVADECTLGSKIVARPPTGNGTYTTWTGAFGDYDETAPDALYALGVADGDRESFTFAAFTALAAGESIGLVKLSTYTNRDVAGPQHFNHFIRRSSTDYDSADKNPGTTASWFHDTWDTDPAGGAWTITNLNAAEFGFRART